MKEINLDKRLILQIIATGSHLKKEFGFTYKQIIDDGFYINCKINIINSLISDLDTAFSMSNAIKKISKNLKILKPDLVILLGDRYEIFAAACSATILRIPIAHLHGGELTEGSFDDSFRHSITKMSYFHFTSHKIYKSRVIQLGENPKRVFNVGAFGIDNINNLKLLSKKDIQKTLNIKFKKKKYLNYISFYNS